MIEINYDNYASAASQSVEAKAVLLLIHPVAPARHIWIFARRSCPCRTRMAPQPSPPSYRCLTSKAR